MGRKFKDLGKETTAGLSPAARRSPGLTTTMEKLGREASETRGKIDRMGPHARSAGQHVQPAARAQDGTSRNLPSTGHVDKLGQGVRPAGEMAAALGVLKKVVGDLGDAIREAREKAEGKGEKALGMRDEFRELANLMGTKDTDEAIAPRQAVQADRLPVDGTREFLQQFIGSVATAEEKGNIRKDQYQSVGRPRRRAAYRVGIDPKVAGRLTGAMLQRFDVNNQFDANGNKLTPEQAMAGKMAACPTRSATWGRGTSRSWPIP